MGANREPLGGHQELLGESECVSVRTSELSCCLLSRRGHVSLVSQTWSVTHPATPHAPQKSYGFSCLDRTRQLVRHASDPISQECQDGRYD